MGKRKTPNGKRKYQQRSVVKVGPVHVHRSAFIVLFSVFARIYRSVLNDSATRRDELNSRNLRFCPACDCQVPIVEIVEYVSGIRSLTIKRVCSCLLLELHPVVGVDYYRRRC